MPHTNGNWLTHETVGGSVFVTTDCPNRMEIASVYGDSPDQARSNARLISASPNLLQAALSAFATVEIDLDHIDSKRDRDALDRIKRDLRKAIIKSGLIDPQVDITLG